MAYDRGLVERVRSLLQRKAEFSERRMFGGLAFMVNGHMCCGVFKTDLVLRLAPETVIASLSEPNTRPMDFTGRPIRSLIYVDAMGIDAEEALERWIGKALLYARSLPPKDGRSGGGSGGRTHT